MRSQASDGSEDNINFLSKIRKEKLKDFESKVRLENRNKITKKKSGGLKKPLKV